MTEHIRCTLVGASGRMGLAILEELEAHPGMHVVHVFVGENENPKTPLGPQNLLPSADLNAALQESDVAIDFSSITGSMALLEAALAQKCAVVSGTTGLDSDQELAWQAGAEHIPICRSANFSVGIQVLQTLVEMATKGCGTTFDVEVFEAHHNQKVDAPSGTALSLGRSAAAGLGVDLDDTFVANRCGLSDARKPGQIGFQALRGGDIVGEHTVYLCGSGERLELTHRATDRAIFARGAIRAATWLYDKNPRYYSFSDVVFENAEMKT